MKCNSVVVLFLRDLDFFRFFLKFCTCASAKVANLPRPAVLHDVKRGNYELLNEAEYNVKNYPRIMQVEAKSPRPKKSIDILLFLLYHHHHHHHHHRRHHSCSGALPIALFLLSSSAISSSNNVWNRPPFSTALPAKTVELLFLFLSISVQLTSTVLISVKKIQIYFDLFYFMLLALPITEQWIINA